MCAWPVRRRSHLAAFVQLAGLSCSGSFARIQGNSGPLLHSLLHVFGSSEDSMASLL
jgi:hypothetical protein